MPIVKAGPSQYLLVGRHGALENRGSAIQAILRPGTIWVLVPSTKQEATFEFTQETKDGIPLRFKGTFIYRIMDPAAAARLFDFGTGDGVGQITTYLNHVCLGELRHAVSHMTMAECIEQRKTTLSGVLEAALQGTIHGDGDGDPAKDWGLNVEAARVAQVFIVDADLRQQLEAEVRNEIRLTSDRSNLQAREQINLAELASEGRVQEQKLAADQEALQRQEAMDLARLARERRMQSEHLATERQALELEQERFHFQATVDQDRLETETPVRLLRIAAKDEILAEELKLRQLQNQVKAHEVERELLLDRARHGMRLEMLPVEQAPQLVEAASKVLHGTTLSIYGEGGRILDQVAPIFDVLSRAVQHATRSAVEPRPEPASASA
jgi:hypothetical protein